MEPLSQLSHHTQWRSAGVQSNLASLYSFLKPPPDLNPDPRTLHRTHSSSRPPPPLHHPYEWRPVGRAGHAFGPRPPSLARDQEGEGDGAQPGVGRASKHVNEDERVGGGVCFWLPVSVFFGVYKGLGRLR